jgi:hypothetical protein
MGPDFFDGVLKRRRILSGFPQMHYGASGYFGMSSSDVDCSRHRSEQL